MGGPGLPSQTCRRGTSVPLPEALTDARAPRRQEARTSYSCRETTWMTTSCCHRADGAHLCRCMKLSRLVQSPPQEAGGARLVLVQGGHTGGPGLPSQTCRRGTSVPLPEALTDARAPRRQEARASYSCREATWMTTSCYLRADVAHLCRCVTRSRLVQSHQEEARTSYSCREATWVAPDCVTDVQTWHI